MSELPTPEDCAKWCEYTMAHGTDVDAGAWFARIAALLRQQEIGLADHDRVVAELTRERDGWKQQAIDRVADWRRCEQERDSLASRVDALETDHDGALRCGCEYESTEDGFPGKRLQVCMTHLDIEGERDSLAAALRKYGDHKHCQSLIDGVILDCNCGFDAALKDSP